MMQVKQCVFTAVLLIAASAVSGYTLPANLKTFYDKHKSPACGKTLKGGFSSAGDNSGNTLYCGDVSGVIYLHSSGGQYADMDIDCDGANRHAGKCANDQSGQDITAFKDTVANYKKGISDLDANLHPYVVFGNEGGNPSFDPKSAGMQPLSVMAVVCGGKLFYGIWGDTNGATSTGESSLAMGNLCFPKENLSGDNGHEPRDVLYLGFTGTAAVPGANGAKWNAGSTQEFEDSIKALGDKLVAKL